MKIKFFNGWQRGRGIYGDRAITITWFGSTPTLVVQLLRLWIRRFTMIISAWWLQTSSKFSGKEVKETTGTWKWTTPKRVRIHPKYSATVVFS